MMPVGSSSAQREAAAADCVGRDAERVIFYSVYTWYMPEQLTNYSVFQVFSPGSNPSRLRICARMPPYLGMIMEEEELYVIPSNEPNQHQKNIFLTPPTPPAAARHRPPRCSFGSDAGRVWTCEWVVRLPRARPPASTTLVVPQGPENVLD